jgi:hypothetical protein
MKAPIRLSDPRSSASSLLRVLVRAGQADLPDTSRMQALEARLGSLAGGATGAAGAAGARTGATGASGTAAGAAGKAASTTLIKVVAAVTVAGTLGGGALLALRAVAVPTAGSVDADTQARAPSAPGSASPSGPGIGLTRAPPLGGSSPAPAAGMPEARLPMTEATQTPVPTPTSTPMPMPTPTPVPRAVPVASDGGTHVPALDISPPAPRSAPVPTSAGDPAEGSEISLLQAAQSALRDRPSDALALADRHASIFAGGSLAQEREVIAIEALLALHRGDEARARGARFLADYPASAYRNRIQMLLAGSRHNP